MYVTQKEAAAAKVCPILNMNCIGSKCMAWRWEKEDRWEERCSDYAAEVQQGLYHSGSPKTLDRQGYCGLAGKPEDEE
jgi:hypothetical protein